MATVVLCLSIAVSSVALASVPTVGMSLMALIAVVLPTPTGPVKMIFCSAASMSVSLQSHHAFEDRAEQAALAVWLKLLLRLIGFAVHGDGQTGRRRRTVKLVDLG